VRPVWRVVLTQSLPEATLPRRLVFARRQRPKAGTGGAEL